MAECSGWSVLNPLCHAESAAQAVVGSAVENVANAVEKRKRKLAVSAAAMETFEKLARTWHALGAGACSGRDLQP